MSKELLLTAPDQYQKMLDNYFSVVEKTNNQLGLWLNVGNFITTILCLLVAVLAAGVGYAIWKNSNEQKKNFREFLENQEKNARDMNDKLQEIYEKRHADAELKLESLIEKQQIRLKSATEDGKKEIQKAIDGLQEKKATIGLYSNDMLAVPYAGYRNNFSADGLLYNTPFTPEINTENLSDFVGYKNMNPLMSKVCNPCGLVNAFDAVFCSRCGSVLS